jgi:hypothetical protein
MPKTTTLVRAFERQAQKVAGSIPAIYKRKFSSGKNVVSLFVARKFSVDCSLNGSKRRTVNAKNASSNLVNPPNLFNSKETTLCLINLEIRRRKQNEFMNF